MKLGLMGNSLRPLIQQGMVYGYDVAVNDLLDSILKYSKMDGITCLYEPGQYQQEIIRRKIKKIRQVVCDKTVDMISEYDVLFYGKEKMPDINILHNVSSEIYPLVALRESLKLPIPVTATVHCASYPQFLNQIFTELVMMPVKSYDAFICTSESVKNAIENILERTSSYYGVEKRIRLETIPLGINTDVFCPGNKMEIREKYNIDKDDFVILWLGRFSAADKADLIPLIKTFSCLVKKNEHRKIKLVLAGYQPMGTDYIHVLEQEIKKAGIANKVILLKNHDIKIRYELYQMSDVFTSPIDNLQETFGITPIEAMSCGIPQVVSDWDGYKDTVVDGVTGFKIPSYWTDCDQDVSERGCLPSDINHRSMMYHYMFAQSVAIDLDEYENAFQKMIDNPMLCAEMSKNSRERAVEKYDLKKVVFALDQLWNELIIESKKTDEKFKDNGFLCPKYCSDFTSYPTRYIDNDVVIGHRDVCINEDYYHFIYNNGELMLPRELLHLIVENTRCDIAFRDICKKITSYPEAMTRRAIMYLIKYGYLRIVKW